MGDDICCSTMVSLTVSVLVQLDVLGFVGTLDLIHARSNNAISNNPGVKRSSDGALSCNQLKRARSDEPLPTGQKRNAGVASFCFSCRGKQQANVASSPHFLPNVAADPHFWT